MAEVLPSLADIDAVLALLPAIERPGAGWHPPWYGSRVEVARLQEALVRHGFMVPFDTSAWEREAERYRRDLAALADAPLADIIKLVTMHLRADRFVGGHFAAVVASGEMAAILRRLAALRDELAGRGAS